MKKKELLGMKSIPASGDILQAVKDDKEQVVTKRWGNGYEYRYKTYRYHIYFQAEMEKGILKIFVYSRKWLLSGHMEPEYIIFLDKAGNDFITYAPLEKKWKTAKIDTLCFTYYTGCRYVGNYQTEMTKSTVNGYLGTDDLEVERAVLNFQCEIRKNQLIRKQKKEMDEIDAVMDEVPQLPKNFDAWVIKNCFNETLFYKPGRKKEVYCTHCGKWVLIREKPEHGKVTSCPRCRTKAIYRSWNKQKYVTDVKTVTILQKLKDRTGYVLRKFECAIRRKRENGWENMEFRKSETIRGILGEDFDIKSFYVHEEYKNTGVVRWCHGEKSGYNRYYTPYFGTAVAFTPNLKMVLKDEAFAKMDLKRIFSGRGERYVNTISILKKMKRYPYMEYLEKSGLTNLADEIWRGKVKKEIFNDEGKYIHEVLKLDKQRLFRLKKMNGGSCVLAALQYEEQTGEKVTDENLAYIKKNRVDIEGLGMGRTHMSLQKTLNFLKRQQDVNDMGFQEVRRYYMDYLDMAEERGMDLTDEIVCKNARMMEYHNRYLEEKNAKREEKRDREVNKKFQEISLGYQENKEHFRWEDDTFMIMVPERASDITREGRLQHHCVGASDNYMRRMAKKESFILFLRRKRKQDMPYYTLEVKWDGTVIQAYAAYDRKPDYKEVVEPVLKRFEKTVQKRMLKEPVNGDTKELQGKTGLLAAG